MAKKVSKKAATKTAPKISNSVKSKKVTFRYAAPDASEVLLAGCFTKWDEKPKKMKKLKNGTWNVRAELKVGDTYRYRYIVDGEWKNDPECTKRETSPFGTENCLITVL
ncbi:MAG: isoamylase early set domain-containing protein [Planctomycetota bacterium]|nr:isoamylase early set domain-containing protein [Planctomycetota bacterium]MDA1138224.1 isoamylase early set domain-containing protein [Planctomycetota bacterium]